MRITRYSLSLTPDKTNTLVKEDARNYEGEKLNSPQEIADMMRTVFDLGNKAEEYFYVVAMNAKCKPIGVFEISHGTSTFSYVDPQAVFSRLLICGGPMWVAVHNHPSGDCTPSKADLEITAKLFHLSKMLGMTMADHIIVSDKSYYSFSLNGTLEE